MRIISPPLCAAARRRDALTSLLSSLDGVGGSILRWAKFSCT